MVCKICGKEFTPSSKCKTICSDECREKNVKLMFREQARRRREKNREHLGTKFCEVCGKEFVPRTSLMVRCSSACTAKRGIVYKRENRKVKKEKIAVAKKLKVDREAEIDKLTVQAWTEYKTSYGKLEMKNYLAKQSDEMAKRRRELDAEWERKKRNA